jgi:hypothetical protein
MDAFKEVLPFVAALGSIASIVLAWMAFGRASTWREKDAVDKRFTDIEASSGRNGAAIQQLQQQIAALPTAASFSDIRVTLARLEARLDGDAGRTSAVLEHMSGQTEQTLARIVRIEEHLLTHPERKK